MLHPQPLDWEVVESHAVAPVQVLFREDGVEIRQIAPNAISGSYTFDMHQSPRKSPPASPKNAAAEIGRPSPGSDLNTSTSTTGSLPATTCSTRKLHRNSGSGSAAPLTGRRAASNPFTFGVVQKRTSPPATAPSKQDSTTLGAPGANPERRRSLTATLSFLQSRHVRDRLGSRSNTPSTTSGVSTSGSEDGEGAEAEAGPRQEKQAQANSSPTRHSAGLYLPIGRSKPTSPSNNYPTTPVAVVALPPPVLAQPSYDKAQTKKVLKHARAELMKEVGKAGYNVLVVEGWELTVLRQCDRYRIKVVYRARPAIAQSDSVEGEGTRVPRNPPYLSVLED